MAEQRLLAPTPQNPAEDEHLSSLRPTQITEYVGQSELLDRLRLAIRAAKQRTEQLDHVLLHGPPGLGKTTLAHVIAKEMGTRLHTTSGPALTRGSDLVGVLTRLDVGDILFIDEIHRTPVAVEEFIYPAMEDFRIDVRVESGPHARTVQIRCKPFTLIGATTRAGLLSSPLRSRFGMIHHLRYYTNAELLQILQNNASKLALPVTDPQALDIVARRARGTPRIANRLLRRVRDFAQVKAGGTVNAEVVDAALGMEGIDSLGLDELDRAYVRAIATTYQGGPVGLEAVAATMNEDAGTLEDVVEPFLLQLGFVARTRRGRMITAAATDHLGMPRPAVTPEDELPSQLF